MATVSKLTADVLCADENCDIILRTGTEARVYRQGTFCLDGHERTGNGTPEAAPDTWLSERLDNIANVLATDLDRIAVALETLAGAALSRDLPLAEWLALRGAKDEGETR